MAPFLGRNLTAIKDITMTRATSTPCEFLIFVPFQCITETQTNRESSITISVEEECNKLLKLCRARQNDKGGNINFMIRTINQIKCRCSSCHFGSDSMYDKILCIVVGGGALRKLISSFMGGPHAGDALPVFQNPQNATAVILSTLPCMRFLRPITCLLEGSSDSQWSSLPTLVLWMIKDRLDFFNNAKVALVCRHWWHASINYPTKMQTVGDGIPWIMLDASVDGNKCARDFMNVERTKKFSVELPEFDNARPIFSKHGWILFGRRKVPTRDRLVESLFLINPLTKGKIQVADLELMIIRNGHYRGCFSISKDGFPNCVVISHVNYGGKGTISLYITYPGGESDQMWTKQTYVGKGFHILLRGLTAISSVVYCSCECGGMIIYDMAGQTWKEIPPPLPSRLRPSFQLMEREGGVSIFGICFASPKGCFFKYSDAHNSWQRYNDDENNLSIFEQGPQVIRNNCLSVAIQRGLNIYTIFQPKGKPARLYYRDMLAETRPFPAISFPLHDASAAVATWVAIG